MTFLIVGILIMALSFCIYALIHFWAEAHMDPHRTGNYTIVMIHSASLPCQTAPARKTPVVIGKREPFAAGASRRRSY